MPHGASGVDRAQRSVIPQLLVVARDPHVRADVRAITRACVDERDTIDDARDAMESDTHVAWLFDVDIDDANVLDSIATVRRRAAILVTTPTASRAVANRAQLFGAEYLCRPYAASNLRSFLDRAIAMRPRVHHHFAAARFAAEQKLTRRETDVVHALVDGVPRAAIATELGVSENTVKTTVRRLLQKTKSGNLDRLRCMLLRRA
jgi:DNA-binding NarL/FixJ family response regulator